MPDKPHGPPAPADIKPTINRYYDDCMDSKTAKGKDNPKEYCARVAWQRFCMHKNPDHPSCTKFGKTKAKTEGTITFHKEKHFPADALVWGLNGKPVKVGQKVTWNVSPTNHLVPKGTHYVQGKVVKVVRKGKDPRAEFKFHHPINLKITVRQRNLDKEPGNEYGMTEGSESFGNLFESLTELVQAERVEDPEFVLDEAFLPTDEDVFDILGDFYS